MRRTRRRNGKTLIQVGLTIGIAVFLAGTQVSVIRRNFKDVKKAEAKSDAVEIALAVDTLFKDVGQWPSTDQDGPTWGPGVERLVSSPGNVPIKSGPKAGPGAENWGKTAGAKPLSDFLFYNNPDDDSGKKGHNEPGQDYPTAGVNRWRGPYTDSPEILDPWGHSYVINARYFPGNTRYQKGVKHRVYVLSAGPNQMWETPFSDDLGDGDDEVQGDDIGVMIVSQ